MTREEIINEIKCILSELNNGEDAVSYLTQNDVKWLNENIKALEQEPILNKIIAEIEPTRKMYFDMNDIDWVNGCDYVLSVIDKYKAESEVEDGNNNQHN